jgi:hypothetical protein
MSPVEPRKGRSEKMEVSPTHFVLKLRPALGDQQLSTSLGFPMNFPWISPKKKHGDVVVYPLVN